MSPTHRNASRFPLVASMLALATILAYGHAQAQLASQAALATEGTPSNSMSIAAVVNEDVITVYDVMSRLKMYMTIYGIEDSPQMRQRLIPQVIQTLTYERLKLQEAKRLKIDVSDSDVREAMDTIEQQNGLAPGAFRKMFDEKNIDMGTLYAQVESDVAWMKVEREDLRHDVSVAPEEVKTVLARLTANQGKPESQVSEIFLDFNSNTHEADVRALADKLVQQARSGTPFAALAQQFSRSATAAVGGDLGWVIRGELQEELDAAVARMEPNEISDPIRTSSGYYIVQLKARRTSGAADPMMAIITMSQIYVPTVGAHAATPERQQQILQAVSTRVSNCSQMNQLAKEMGGPGSGPIETLRVGMLPTKMREAVANLRPNQVSPPIELKGARVYAMICTRQDDTGLPSEDQVYDKLENDKLENVAQQRLRELFRQAIFEDRM